MRTCPLPLGLASSAWMVREPSELYYVHAASAQACARILVVDDQPRRRFELVERLKSFGAAALAVDDIFASLQAIAWSTPALILINCHGPGMDGYETARRIRRWEAEQGVPRRPIIALCDVADAAHGQRCVDAVLKKPVRAQDLQAVLQRWFEHPWPSSGEQAEPIPAPGRIDQACRLSFAEDARAFGRVMQIQDRVELARLRVMLLDDHEVMRHALEFLLRQQYSLDVVGSFRTSAELFAALKQICADVILCDYALGRADIDGLNLIRRLKQHAPHARILMMSADEDAGTASLAMRAGAHGFVCKKQDSSDLFLAIRTVAKGRTYLCPELLQAIEAPAPAGVEAGNELLGYARLSPREREVLRCLLDGMSVTQIAKKFSREVTTISAQKHAAFRKLGIHTNNELFKIHKMLGR
ncbi:response regulator [Dyella flagellata]|uniref:Uncharacterized protein n=1 Tax=Dyella flagellata TaxID=1867833 RepID=A0ABQ5X5I5_9GAMM|nr:response regulator [Dyella flagellata]GLQ86864.1 hypothetical protein GCM10007898_04300 [Dyella flagellata]